MIQSFVEIKIPESLGPSGIIIKQKYATISLEHLDRIYSLRLRQNRDIAALHRGFCDLWSRRIRPKSRPENKK